MRKHQSQILLPLFSEGSTKNQTSLQSSLPTSPMKPKRRNLSKKLFNKRSSSVAFLSLKTDKVASKSEPLVNMVNNYLAGCTKHETLELTEPKEDAYIKCANIGSNLKRKIDFFFKPYDKLSNNEGFHALPNYWII